jgi:hypothetical protein
LPKATRPCANRAVISRCKEEEEMFEIDMRFNLAIRLPLRWIAALLYLLK